MNDAPRRGPRVLGPLCPQGAASAPARAPRASAAGGSRGASERRDAGPASRLRRRSGREAAVAPATPAGRGRWERPPPGGGPGHARAPPLPRERSPARAAGRRGCWRRVGGGERRLVGASSAELPLPGGEARGPCPPAARPCPPRQRRRALADPARPPPARFRQRGVKGEAEQSGVSFPSAEQPPAFRWLMQRLSVRLRSAERCGRSPRAAGAGHASRHASRAPPRGKVGKEFYFTFKLLVILFSVADGNSSVHSPRKHYRSIRRRNGYV